MSCHTPDQKTKNQMKANIGCGTTGRATSWASMHGGRPTLKRSTTSWAPKSKNSATSWASLQERSFASLDARGVRAGNQSNGRPRICSFSMGRMRKTSIVDSLVKALYLQMRLCMALVKTVVPFFMNLCHHHRHALEEALLPGSSCAPKVVHMIRRSLAASSHLSCSMSC